MGTRSTRRLLAQLRLAHCQAWGRRGVVKRGEEEWAHSDFSLRVYSAHLKILLLNTQESGMTHGNALQQILCTYVHGYVYVCVCVCVCFILPVLRLATALSRRPVVLHPSGISQVVHAVQYVSA